MRTKTLPYILLSVLTISSCASTRDLLPGEYLLVQNNVQIEGASELKAKDITPYVRQQVKSGLIPGMNIFGKGLVFNESLVESSCANIINHLDYLGYYNSKVWADISYKGHKAVAHYMVIPGSRYHLGQVSYELPKSAEFIQEFLSDTTNSYAKQGEILSEEMLEKESNRAVDYLRNCGYYNLSSQALSFVADTLGRQGLAKLQYKIDASAQKYQFGNVSISYSKDLPFKDDILKEMTTIHPGMPYSAKEVNTSYSRLSALKLFSSVSMELAPQENTNVVDCNIKLADSQPKGFKINLEASTNSSGLLGISPQVTFYHKNIFHGGEWLNLNFTGNFQTKINDRSIKSNESGVTASLSFPKMFGVPMSLFHGPTIPRTDINLSFNYQSRPEFTRSIGSFSFGYSASYFDNRLSVKTNILQVNYVDLFSISESFSQTLDKNPYMKYMYQDHFDAGVGATIYYTSNTDIVPKTDYHYALLNLDLSGNVISLFDKVLNSNQMGEKLLLGAPYARYARAEFDLGKTLRWGKNDGNAFAMHLTSGIGYAYGNSSVLPFEKQFYCGGANSLRAWQARSVGPGFDPLNESFSIPSQTGDFMMEAGIEYRFAIVSKLEGALFAESGNVWNTNDMKKDFLKALAADCGLGLRVNLDFILLRLDAGFKIHDPAREQGHRWVSPSGWFSSDGCAIHFGVGYPF